MAIYVATGIFVLFVILWWRGIIKHKITINDVIKGILFTFLPKVIRESKAFRDKAGYPEYSLRRLHFGLGLHLVLFILIILSILVSL